MWKCCDCCEASSDEQHSCAEKNDEEAKIGGEMEEQVTEDEETEDSIEMEEQVTEGDETEDSIEDEEVIYEGPENQLYFDYPINQEIQNNNTFEPGVSVLLANTDDGQGNVCLAKTITSYRFKPRELAIGNCSTTLKDSAIAAEMYIRKNQSALKLTLEVDMHLLVHLFPSEMPKSGFSAGCAIATSMISAIKNIGVPNGIILLHLLLIYITLYFLTTSNLANPKILDINLFKFNWLLDERGCLIFKPQVVIKLVNVY
ncbi:unnamed protein product [Meloidogyne enterolobii]|uniref:Uncharacterized protein n=1 Tax=Meloidogyne enterolobii TaxID=390850 RepID=A0ACB1A990_MELEN